jgi:hypothetical protein
VKTVLFVAYGGGHIKMLLPVAQRLRESGIAQPRILALTTAAVLAREAGFQPLGFADFVTPEDASALEIGGVLASDLPPSDVSKEESIAYLGLSFMSLVSEVGEAEAQRRYTAIGRQCFEPVSIFRRILSKLRPDVLVTTNSPRAEKAAVLAAAQLAIPAICVVDLFAMDEIAWLGRPGYANKICVLHPSVRDRLIQAGRAPHEVVATGNPAFDGINTEKVLGASQRIREEQHWNHREIVLYASQPEPLHHPSVPGQTGDPTLPARIQEALEHWARKATNRLLVIRKHPSESNPIQPSEHPTAVDGAVIHNGRQFELHPLLHAVDLVVTMNSTVGLEACIAGRPVIQVLGSLFDASVPLAQFGLAHACTATPNLGDQIDTILSSQRHRAGHTTNLGLIPMTDATQFVLDVVKEFIA